MNDLTGNVYGMLTVIEAIGTAMNNGAKVYRCECECGNYVDVRGDNLKLGNTKSCGCYKKMLMKVKTLSGKTLADKSLQERLDIAEAELVDRDRLIAQLGEELIDAEEEIEILGKFLDEKLWNE